MALKPWLAEKRLSHVKNRYPREDGKGVFNEKGDMGCERYAYFDKYMVTMGSWAMLGWLFADPDISAAESVVSSAPSVFVTSPDFHFVFLQSGEYSAQFDYGADSHYDCDGLGRLCRRGIPAALCLSTPCAKSPNYRIERPNDDSLAIVPVDAKTSKALRCSFERAVTNGNAAVCEWRTDNSAWRCTLTPEGLTSDLTGDGEQALSLPVFAFDGRDAAKITMTGKTLSVTYRGAVCTYETDGKIVDTGRTAANRNGRYHRYEARGKNNLKVKARLQQSL